MPADRQRFTLLPPIPEEHELQVDCTRMLAVALLPDVCWTAIDHAHSLNMQLGRNGRPIGLIEAQKRKARGIKAGIADYLFWYDGDSYAIELKRDADSTLSDDQEVWLRAMIKAGAMVKVCWLLDQVFQTVYEWGLVRPGVTLR
jgi:VRR-NUC domain